MSDDSLDLLARLEAGDRDAVDALLRRNLPGLRTYVRLHSGPLLRAREASGDLVQSVCREVLTHLDRFRYPSEAGFRQWLFVTALRKIRRRYEYWGAQRRDAGSTPHGSSVRWPTPCTSTGPPPAGRRCSRCRCRSSMRGGAS